MPTAVVFVAGFDLLLRDTVNWTSRVLGEVLDVPTVEISAIPLIPPCFGESQLIPNPVAYIPQFATLYTSSMVRIWEYHSADLLGMPITLMYQLQILSYQNAEPADPCL